MAKEPKLAANPVVVEVVVEVAVEVVVEVVITAISRDLPHQTTSVIATGDIIPYHPLLIIRAIVEMIIIHCHNLQVTLDMAAMIIIHCHLPLNTQAMPIGVIAPAITATTGAVVMEPQTIPASQPIRHRDISRTRTSIISN